MAGIKGRSGGARPGAGRKKIKAGVTVALEPQAHGGALKRSHAEEPEPTVVDADMDPLDFLEGVMRGLIEATPLQVRAAIAAAQYRHTKRGDGGKKDEVEEKAHKASKKFAPAAPPKLVSSR